MSEVHHFPVVPLPHHLQEEAALIEHELMEDQLRKFHSEDEWRASGNHERFERYVAGHPDELVSLNKDGLRKLQEEIDAQRI